MRKAIIRKGRDKAPIQKQARLFFARLQGDSAGKNILYEQNHRIEFDLEDGHTFYVEILRGKVKVRAGSYHPRCFNSPDLIHFQLKMETLVRMFSGKIRFTDALIPADPNGHDRMLLLECGLFKWSVLNWVGRLFRAGQLPSRYLD